MIARATLDQHFEAALDRFESDRIAFAFDEDAVTYGGLAALVDRLAAGLRTKGMGHGDVVGYTLPNSPEALAIFLALSRIGARAVPLIPAMPDPVRAGIFSAMGCSRVITADSSITALGEAAQRIRATYSVLPIDGLKTSSGDGGGAHAATPNEPLLAAASSGTTGAPKSVWLTQGNVASALTAAADMARVGSWRDDPSFSSVMAFPISTSAVMVALGVLLVGVRLIFSRDVSPIRYLDLAGHWKVEALSAPPSYLETLLTVPPTHARPVPQVRAALTGMDFLHPSLLARLAERFPALDRAASGYGLVETSTVFMTWKAHHREELEHPTNVFTLCPGVSNEIDVRNDEGQSLPAGPRGELWVHGPSVASGYLGQPQDRNPFVDGWFATGDAACRVDAQRIELRGRQKYIIKRAGKSVAPTEVQNRLDECPGVVASAVVGVRQPLYGEMIWAFVVADRSRPANLKDIMKQCRTTLPNHMVPDRVTFLNELPRGAGVGKVDREALIRQADRELESTQGESRDQET